MKAIRANELRDNFKQYADMAANGETIIVSRPKNRNVIIISEDEYNSLVKARKNTEYLAMIDASMGEFEAGKGITETLAKLEKMANG